MILVDQNHDDRLIAIVAQFTDQFPLKHIRDKGEGCSRGRNFGLDKATGELVGFLDDECQYLDGYLDAVDGVFSEDPSMQHVRVPDALAAAVCCMTAVIIALLLLHRGDQPVKKWLTSRLRRPASVAVAA